MIDQSSGKKQESAQSQSMTFVNKAESAADNQVDDVTASLAAYFEQRKIGIGGNKSLLT